MSEDGRVAIRNIRREINEEFKKMENESKITEDDLKKYQEEVQEITDEHIEKINDSLSPERKRNYGSVGRKDFEIYFLLFSPL